MDLVDPETMHGYVLAIALIAFVVILGACANVLLRLGRQWEPQRRIRVAAGFAVVLLIYVLGLLYYFTREHLG